TGTDRNLGRARGEVLDVTPLTMDPHPRPQMSIELAEATIGKRIRGPDLYYASAMPSEGLKAVLGIIHGYADHGARYRHVMGALAEHGIGSIAIDLRGHGRALGPRGSCLRFDEFLDDA